MSFEFLTSLIFWDLLLLVLFTAGVSVFLYKRRKKVEREGPLFLYKTQIGVKILDRLGKKYRKLWNLLSYLIIIIGYFLMITFTYFLIKSVYMYIKYPIISKLIKAPPVMILVPYFTRIFGAQSLFPEFYFIYFVIAIAIIAIVHEGAHGIYARLHNVKIKSTGFGFLGPFLAFFVEQDDKQMTKKKIFPQLQILGAGVFANIITAIIVFLLLILMFNSAYAPYGIQVSDYSISRINASELIEYEATGKTINVNGDELSQILISNKTYFVGSSFFDVDLEEIDPLTKIDIYQDQPAIKQEIAGNIISLNNKEFTDVSKFREEMENYKPGDVVNIKTDYNGKIKKYEIELGESYDEEGRGVIGIMIGNKNPLWFFNIIEPFKEEGVVYRAKVWPEFMDFIYYLLGWIIVINGLVALVNMLPLGIFDGGRFFYLTVLAITKKEKIASIAFRAATFILLGLVVLMMAWWVWIRLIG